MKNTQDVIPYKIMFLLSTLTHCNFAIHSQKTNFESPGGLGTWNQTRVPVLLHILFRKVLK